MDVVLQDPQPDGPPVTESAQGRGDGLANLPGAGLLGWLQRRHKQRCGSCRANSGMVPGSRHRGPPRGADHVGWPRRMVVASWRSLVIWAWVNRSVTHCLRENRVVWLV